MPLDPACHFAAYGVKTASQSVDAGHHCFWGQFQLMVNARGQSILESLGLPVAFHRAELSEGRDLSGLVGSLSWVTPTATAEADPVASKNAICEHCGEFTERQRAITRLRIPKSNVPPGGLFTVTQNGTGATMFITESTRKTLKETELLGLGFYPAGRVV